MFLKLQFILFFGVIFSKCVYSHANSGLISYLQSESLSISSLIQKQVQILKGKRIPIGLKNSQLNIPTRTEKLEVALSTPQEQFECRVSLEPVPIGKKCIAPCGCTGSQKWIQFSEFNRLRRKDPQQFVTCSSCLQPYRIPEITQNSGIITNIFSSILDRPIIFRSFFVLGLALISHLISLPLLVSRFLFSEFVWKLFPWWYSIVSFPLPFHLYFLRMILLWTWRRYKQFEKDYVIDLLARIESYLIEPTLSVTQASTPVERETKN